MSTYQVYESRADDAWVVISPCLTETDRLDVGAVLASVLSHQNEGRRYVVFQGPDLIRENCCSSDFDPCQWTTSLVDL